MSRRRRRAVGHAAAHPARRATARRVLAWADPARAPLAALPHEKKLATLGVLISWIALLQADGHLGVARIYVTCRFFPRDAHPGAQAPHHCAPFERPLAEADLRVDCPAHAAP